MNQLTIAVNTAPSVRDNLTTQLRFHFPEITALEFADGEVTIHAGQQLATAAVERTVRRILDRFNSVPPAIRSKVLLDSRVADSVQAWGSRRHAFPVAVLADAARAFSKELRRAVPPLRRRVLPDRSAALRAGINVYGHETAALLAALDRLTASCIRGVYEAEVIHVPSLIPSSLVERAGYVDTGCQHLSFIAPLSTDPDVFDAFVPFWKSDGRDDRRVLDYVRTPRDVLSPAVCLPSYPLLEGKTVASDEALVLSFGGSVFRDESGNLNNRERLLEFHIQETVVIGGAEPLARIHGELADLMVCVASVLGLDFSLQTAADIFFGDAAGSLLFTQLASTNKIELAVRSASVGHPVATASLNKHGSHFAKAFDITDERGLPTSTMCLGFGLDRLAYLLFERFGLDLAALGDHVDANVEALLKERA
ncbi:hypothetical protein AV521_08055 [Streptomyces sp. IMTB 2501]|nr:hypothetical protein AV521_08055 [Streptomyces sp. IMTB 2501]